MTGRRHGIADADWADAETIWNYHQLHHRVRPCSVGIGLGSHDLGVAAYAAELYHAGMFDLLLFTGGNSPTTTAWLPRGEAVHYRERAMELGVPASAILLETEATNTGENINLSRALLRRVGITVQSVLLVSKPYMQRRAFTTCRKLWPEVEVVCASAPVTFSEYVESIGDVRLVVDMIVGDLQRVLEYPRLGYAIAQDVPPHVKSAYQRLKRSGFDSRLLPR